MVEFCVARRKDEKRERFACMHAGSQNCQGDFDSVHTHHEEDPSVPLDDRDFDSHHTKRPRVVVGTDEQKMRNLRPVDETESSMIWSTST